MMRHNKLTERIIPACAGSTYSGAPCPAQLGDHPRVCGEHPTALCNGLQRAGSSPRVRGAPGDSSPVFPLDGIIPACAGSTLTLKARNPCAWDHPRVCGEHTHARTSSIVILGSSPRVRGAPPAGRDFRPGRRIIPACAGSTNRLTVTDAPTWDHPRVCGEHAVSVRAITFARGSSPRVRGAPLGAPLALGENGIIPACAGSTAFRLADNKTSEGSSPRVRGALDAVSRQLRRGGIIPACAGSTCPR